MDAAIFGLLGSLVGLVGGVVTTRPTIKHQEPRTDLDWARNERREFYAQYSGLLNAIRYIVTYGDQCNLRTGNEAKKETKTAQGIYNVEPGFFLLASCEMQECRNATNV